MPEIKQEDYKNCIVVFLDLLGIGEFTKKASPATLIKVYQSISHTFNLAEEIRKSLDVEEPIFGMNIKTSELLEGKYVTSAMSDSIILTLDEDRIEFLGFLLSTITMINLHFLLSYNLTLRGGVTLGLIHHKKDNPIIFGKGLIAANELQYKADYPRVVIDDSVILRYQKAINDKKRIQRYKRDFPHMKQHELYFKSIAGIDALIEKEKDYSVLRLFNEQNFKGNQSLIEEYYTKIPEIIKDHTQRSWPSSKKKPSSTIKEKWEYLQGKWDEFVKLHPYNAKS